MSDCDAATLMKGENTAGPMPGLPMCIGLPRGEINANAMQAFQVSEGGNVVRCVQDAEKKVDEAIGVLRRIEGGADTETFRRLMECSNILLALAQEMKPVYQVRF